jgi:uncharacterized protein YacL
MDQLLLPFFLFNCLMIIVDASIGYYFAPQLLSGIEDAEVMESSIRNTRRLLSAVVAIYMFFNCLGYFQARQNYLFAVTGLIAMDLAIQYFLNRRKRNGDYHSDDQDH